MKSSNSFEYLVSEDSRIFVDSQHVWLKEDDRPMQLKFQRR